MTKKTTAAFSEGSAFTERKRGLEEEYFHKKEQELIEKLRQRARLEAERNKMAETLGSVNLDILAHLQEMGYTPDTVALLYLVPLVQVAWAEGVVTRRERQLILKAAESRGIFAVKATASSDTAPAGALEPSPAYEQLTKWLEHHPSEEFFENTLRVISALLAEEPPVESELHKRDLISYCTEIARVSGGILGIGAISEEERAVLEHIIRDLDSPDGHVERH